MNNKFLAFTAVTAIVLAACGATPTPAPKPTEAPKPAAPAATTAPAAPAATAVPAATAAPKPTDAPKPAAGPETIRIYSSFPLQGSSKSSSDQINNAIAIAIETLSKGGLVCDGKFKIDFVKLDDSTAAAGKWDAATEQANATKAVADKDAMAYIGTLNSGAAKVSIPILNQAKMGMISPANTYDGLTKPADAGEPDKYYPNGVRNYMRVVPADGLQGAFNAQWTKGLGAKTIYILDDTELYGKGLADVYEKTAKEIGLNVLGRTGIDGKAKDFKALATKIKGLNPDLIYYGGITDNGAGQLVKDIRGAGIKAMIMGADGIAGPAFINAAGKDIAEGIMASAGVVPFNLLPPEGQKFEKDFAAKLGIKKEDFEIYAKYGYAAAEVTMNAITKVCAKDRDAIRKAMIETQGLKTVVGTMTFDKNGDTTDTTMTGFIITKGELTETQAKLAK
ncbi:MAG: branched-chain amino acid ABC transporter substrate-binding protein [Chloroflexi bacterium]|jgi:branched-chain amino acid transport system substrate-binding protein|nr:branched-chain amino acid ABC transporter substrate-binding protein [Chloroflexota bacterium]